MTVEYLQGGDSYQVLDHPIWAGQTFIPLSPFVLKWIDLNLKLSGQMPQALCTLWNSGDDHLPTGDILSLSSYWLINPPFGPTDWHFYEPWGKTLTENNRWTFLNPPPEVTYSLTNGFITLTNFGYYDIGINFTPLVNYPLLDVNSKRLHLSIDCPEATVDYITTRIGLGGYFHHSVHGQMHFALWIALGATYYDDGQYGVEAGPPFPRGWKYIGVGKHTINIVSLWQQWRASLGESTDPTGWSVSNFHFALGTTSPSRVDHLANEHIGWYYPSSPGSPPSSPTKGYTLPNKLYRVRFKMKEVLLNAYSYYFIRLCVFPSLLESAHHWQYDKADSQYLPGIRLSSPDGGSSWAKHFDDDHLFAVLGTPPSPISPIEPPVMNWSTLLIEQIRTATGFKIIVTTNSPCHLFMYWTLQEPDKHKRTMLVRGLTVPTASQYCFVDWVQNEQLETGDTIIHTFTKEPWAVCETRWFIFRGTINNDWVASISPIFTKHRLPLPPCLPSNDSQLLCVNNSGFCQLWNVSAQTFTPDHDYTSCRLGLFLNQWKTTQRGPFIVKITLPDGDCWSEPILVEQPGYSTDLPLPGVIEEVEFRDIIYDFLEGVVYRIVVHTTPGWEYWDGSKWTIWEQGAAMRWWGKDTGNPYARGYKWWGCNFYASSGSWTRGDYGDRAFQVYE